MKSLESSRRRGLHGWQRTCDLKVAVDDLDNAKDISNAVSEVGSHVGLVVDVNLSGGSSPSDHKLEGMLNRCGVPPGKPGADLAVEVAKLPNVHFKGIMGYEGGLPDFPEMEKSNSVAKESSSKGWFILETRSKSAVLMWK